MKFSKIVAIDYTGIDEFIHEELKGLCEELVMYEDIPVGDDEIVQRAEGADAILVSWNTPVSRAVIKRLPTLKYIGMCCSLYDEESSNVDIQAAQAQDIIVRGVKDYGDDGVVEWIFSELVRLFKGSGNVQFREEQIELGGVKLGIIGLGTLGQMVADAGMFFSMDVCYYNRNKKEGTGFAYLALEELLKTCDVISTHLPRNTNVLGSAEFAALGNGKVLINTGLSPSFEINAFDRWLECENNYALFDVISLSEDLRKKYENHPRVIMSKTVTGFTRNARRRLALKVLENILIP
ncbi:MAG: hypothetical protein JEY99_05565 [Spirochaetales bacterium]|nr:hypothetical protein [Spirochaetales bacterium]